MKNLSSAATYFSGSDDASVNMPAIPGGQIIGLSFIVSFTDSASGTLQIQCSNDFNTNILASQNTPVTWVNVPGANATATVTAGATAVVYVPVNFFAQNYRLVWTVGSGSGTMTAKPNAVGN